MTPTQNLFVSQGFRILFTVVVLFFVHIPLLFKVLLVILSDFFDNCIPLRKVFKDWVDPNTKLYQLSDKITDLMTSYILLFYLFKYPYLVRNQNLILFYLLLYRSIGQIIFFIWNDQRILLLFPNFFLEFSLLFIGMKYFHVSKKYLPFLTVLIIVWKIVQEYYLHVYKVKKQKDEKHLSG